ncbi:hypothetical protein GCM10011394_27940 [Luteimonas terricola]|uniref:Uncharacterized protein n=1 Tax=Luteimonas terricola TaxID=645597 RepID=A0ABQ2EN24_9GAMM|nr:hypothetical protein GCM10011394_27940 [Luteimonas terricola]
MEFAVYLLGVVFLGTFYYPLKAATGGGVWFVLAVVVYLIFVRLVGYGVKRLVLARRESPHE